MPKAGDIKYMFDSVADRYDLLNRVLSLGRDIYWRKALAKELAPRGDCRALDICCGTGDVALSLLRGSEGNLELTAADFSTSMCRAAREKILHRYRGSSRLLVTGADALRLPFGDAAFDFATVAFGVRNFEDLQAGLAELARVIRPAGQLGILEFAPPRGALLNTLYRPYLSTVPPVLGKLLACSAGAYRYLYDSIRSFLEPAELSDALSSAGFENIRCRKLTFGITCLYLARRR